MIVYFSGAQTPAIKEAYRSQGVQHLAVSFFYMKGGLLDEPGIFVDAGGATLRKQGHTPEEIEDYFDNYCAFLEVNKENISFCTEFDIEDDEVRQRYRTALRDIMGDKLLPIIRPDDSYNGEYDDYQYIAIPRMKSAHDYNSIISSADFIERKVRFHGLGIADPEVLRTVSLYSADTYAPLLGGKYKAYYEFKSGQLKRVADSNTSASRRASFRSRVRKQVKDAHIEWTAFDAEEYTALNQWNARQWLDYVATLVAPQYLFTQEERNLAIALKREELGITTAEGKTLLPVVMKKGYDNDLLLAITRKCNTCAFGGGGTPSCPVYEPDADCRLESYVAIESPDDVVDAYHHILTLQVQRVRFAAMQEKLQGGVISPEVSEQMEATSRMMEGYRKTASTANELTLTAKGEGVGVLHKLMNSIHDSRGPHGDMMVSKASLEERRRAIEMSAMESDKLEQDIVDADFEDIEVEPSED